MFLASFRTIFLLSPSSRHDLAKTMSFGVFLGVFFGVSIVSSDICSDIFVLFSTDIRQFHALLLGMYLVSMGRCSNFMAINFTATKLRIFFHLTKKYYLVWFYYGLKVQFTTFQSDAAFFVHYSVTEEFLVGKVAVNILCQLGIVIFAFFVDVAERFNRYTVHMLKDCIK